MVSKPKFKLDDQSAITPELANQALFGEQRETNPGQLTAFKGQLAIILEIAHSEFVRSVAAEKIVERLAQNLHNLRSQAGPAIWKLLIPIAQQHPLQKYLLQDPFTKWSFEKPRGYSGDATLLDIYYQHSSTDEIIDSATPLGKEIYAYTSNAASSVAGRERRDILAQYVDRVCRKNHSAEILSVACGHLRESEKSEALARGDLKRWVALDQDPQSIVTVMQNNPADIVKPIQGSVRGLLRRSYKLGSFDLVYASGLYDYLQTKLGAKLLQRCWELVKPGGMFMFANFSDEIQTDGYMETFMDWPLILRNEADMQEIIDAALPANEFKSRTYYGSNRNIVYAEVTRLN